MTYSYTRFLSIFIFTTICLITYWALFPISGAAQAYKSLLWQIEGKGMKTPSYLYGTMHSKDLRVHDLSDSVYVAIERCPAMALEIVTQEQDQTALMSKMFMRDTTLQQLYSPEDYKKVNAAIQKKMGLMALMFKTDKMKPIFLVTMLG